MTQQNKETMQKPDLQDQDQQPESVNARRRFLMRAGVSSTLLLTATSRPAWAQGGMCTASALASANASGGHDFEGCSISAGWWMNKTEHWPVSHLTPFHSVFGFVSFNNQTSVLYSGLTLHQVITINGGGSNNPGNLGMHLIGAYLNALAFPPDLGGPGYAFTAQEVVNAYSALHGQNMDGFQALKSTLETANNQFDNDTEKPEPF